MDKKYNLLMVIDRTKHSSHKDYWQVECCARKYEFKNGGKTATAVLFCSHCSKHSKAYRMTSKEWVLWTLKKGGKRYER